MIPFVPNQYYRKNINNYGYYPNYSHSYYNNYYNQPTVNKIKTTTYPTYSSYPKNNNSNLKEVIKEEEKEPEVFEIFGLKLHFDDILLICLIFFLYNEGVKDPYLFISLILLLIS